MYLLEMMLPNYIKIVEAYISSKNFNFLTRATRAMVPNEVRLSDTKKALAERLLKTLHTLHNTHIEHNAQDMNSDIQVVVDGVATGRMSARLSDLDNIGMVRNSVNSSDMAARIPTSSSICSSIYSFRQRNNTNELRNKGSNSELSGNITSHGTFDGVYNTGDTLSTYDFIVKLDEELNGQIEACEKARAEHGDHKPGSYDAILNAMQDHLNFIKMRTQHMLTFYNVHGYSAKNDKKKFKQGDESVPYRDNLYKITHAFLCMAKFDKIFVDSKLATVPQKHQYALGDNKFLMRNPNILNEVEYKLISIAQEIFSHDFDEVQQFLKTLADYTLVYSEMQRIPAIAKLFDAQLLEFKSDLMQLFEKRYPFIQAHGSIEDLIHEFIKAKKMLNAPPCVHGVFRLDDDVSIASSPYPVISRM